MKKFTPSITIWNLCFICKEDETICENHYFLSKNRAKKFWKKHEKECEEYNVILGGEQLWLW